MKTKVLVFLLGIVSLNVFAMQKQLSDAEARQFAAAEAEIQSQLQALESDERVAQWDRKLKASVPNDFALKFKQACFTKGTYVLLSQEQPECKEIQDIQVGESVLSYDEVSDSFVSKKVEEVFRILTNSLIEIRLDNGQLIEATDDHPFFVGGEWVSAWALKKGDLVKGTTGSLRIESLLRRTFEEPIEVYDIRVDTTHNYFVVGNGQCLASAALVHNCNGAKEFGKGFAVGLSESMPGASQHPPQGSDAFEIGRATGQTLGGTAQVAVGTTGILAGASEVAASCVGTACAAAPAGVAVVGASAALAGHGANVIVETIFNHEGQGTSQITSEGETGFKGRRGISENKELGIPKSEAFELRQPKFQPNRNTPEKIGDREYSGHALDQMQNRGLTPTVVEDTIKNGVKSADPSPDRIRYYSPQNDITIVTDEATGRVITTILGKR